MNAALHNSTWVAAAMLLIGLLLWIAGVTGRGDELMHAGILLLIATPIVRVVVALFEFLRERDWAFVAVTLVILLSLAFPIVRFALSLRG